ncbi:MAG: response regulator, partial [Elusimicrobia bacterium]|nr:response regulator [Elusimicrobiota bacterium]
MGEFARKTEKADGIATILLVEDDVGCRSFLRDLLSFEGYGVIVSESASEALRMLSHAIHRPDLLIVDFHMSHMNGFELVRELRSKEEFRATPILMFSSTHKQIQETIQLEGVQFLSKSSPNQLILETIRRLVPLRATPVRAEVETVARSGDHLIDLARDLPLERFSDSSEAKPGWFRKFFGEKETPEPDHSPRQSSQPEIESLPEPPPEPKAALWTPPEPDAQTPVPVPAPKPVLETPSPNGTGSLIDDEARSLAERFARLTEDLSGTGLALRDGELSREVVEDPHAPAVRLVEELLSEAMQRRASDIHLEPQDGEIIARVRIDGTLHPLVRLPAKLERTLASRVKILA